MSNLSYAYFLAGRLDAAITTATKASALDPKLGSAWINLGTALAKKGDLPAAERAYQRALSLDPSDPRAQSQPRRTRRDEARPRARESALTRRRVPMSRETRVMTRETREAGAEGFASRSSLEHDFERCFCAYRSFIPAHSGPR